MLTDFESSSTDRLSSKFATKLYLTIPPHLKYVATLPCEIWMPETGGYLVNDKSQNIVS